MAQDLIGEAKQACGIRALCMCECMYQRRQALGYCMPWSVAGAARAPGGEWETVAAGLRPSRGSVRRLQAFAESRQQSLQAALQDEARDLHQT